MPIDAISRENFWCLKICCLNIKTLIIVKKNKKYNLFSSVACPVLYPLSTLYTVIIIPINTIIEYSTNLLGFFLGPKLSIICP